MHVEREVALKNEHVYKYHKGSNLRFFVLGNLQVLYLINLTAPLSTVIFILKVYSGNRALLQIYGSHFDIQVAIALVAR